MAYVFVMTTIAS